MSDSRASVSSQTTIQPLILAAKRSSSMSSRESSQRSKRDSATDLGTLLHRKSFKKRPVSDPDTMPPATPTYRLYPHQASNGRRSLRAMAASPDSENTFVVHSHSQSLGAELLVGTRPDLQYSDGTNGANPDDYSYTHDRQHSLPTELLTPEGDRHDPHADSPVVSEIDDRYDSAPPPREVPTRGSSKQVPSRIKYDHTVSQEDLRERPRVHARTHSGQSNGQPKHTSQTPRQQSAPARRHVSAVKPNYSRPTSPDRSPHVGYGVGDRSSADSIISQETEATSVSTLPALQTKGPDNGDAQYLEPVLEDDPASWDLVDPPDESDGPQGRYALEKRADQMFSAEHLRTIFDDPKLLLKFTGYLNAHRPKSISILIYYLDALKAIRAINYANAIAEALEPIRAIQFTENPAPPTKNNTLEKQAKAAFDMMVQEDLPAFIAHIWIQVVSVSIQRRITGTLAPHLREASEGLAEVFCLTDPSRADNPIVFASEEFVRTTQYGMNYVIGRNCRFLQGPHTNPNSVRRFAIATSEGREHTEVFVNYRRDGSPFMNLLMTAPLMDSRGTIRYYIGAQVDVSGLVKECSHLEGLLKMVEDENDPDARENEEKKDEFQVLTEMFNSAELDTVRRFGGRMHKEYIDDTDRESIAGDRRRLLIKDSTQEVLEKHGAQTTSSLPTSMRERINGKLEGIYQNYLLIRPAPSLRILFTSPSLRVPGILQSPFLDRIGGSSRVRSDLRAALGEGRGVTAKIRWLTRADKDGEGEGRPRWIHCTPLFGHSGSVGVWMVVLVDDETSVAAQSGRRFRPAPPVSDNIGGKQWDARAARERRAQYEPSTTMTEGGESRKSASRPDVERGTVVNAGTVNRTSSYHARAGPSSSHSQQAQYGVASGDVSEFSFQLK